MHKNWYLFCAIAGVPGTMVVAYHHELGWTLFGAFCVGMNLYNYLNR